MAHHSSIEHESRQFPPGAIPVLNAGYVALVETWGADERIIEAARMSTRKGFQGWGPMECPCYGRMTPQDPKVYDEACPRCKGTGQVAGDEKLLRYLWEHQHLTPFEMAGMTLEVQAPIFVFREWHRHRTQSYNELSARYTELPNMVYYPDELRWMGGKQSDKNKQASVGGFGEAEAKAFSKELHYAYEGARRAYESLLAQGVARELARLVLPVAQYSRMRASANLRNWLAFLTLRQASGAQWEIRQYATVVGQFVAHYFPRTWALFSQEGDSRKGGG